jgi:hypothetical protein
MIIAAALCPWPPLLVRELTGVDPVAAELREACAAAVGALLAAALDVVAVVGPAASTAEWPAGGRLNIAAFGGRAASSDGSTTQPAGSAAAPAAAVPPAVGLGAYLLDQAGYAGRRRLYSVTEDESPEDCDQLGKEISGTAPRTGLLVMGDGSARHSPRAPGYFDERAAAFDAEVERALRAPDLGALEAIDPALARELKATGRPAWQVLSGAARGTVLRADVMYADDPFGVMYFVASFAP